MGNGECVEKVQFVLTFQGNVTLEKMFSIVYDIQTQATLHTWCTIDVCYEINSDGEYINVFICVDSRCNVHAIKDIEYIRDLIKEVLEKYQK